MGVPMHSALTPRVVSVLTSQKMASNVASVVWLASNRPGTPRVKTLRPQHIHPSSWTPTFNRLARLGTLKTEALRLLQTSNIILIGRYGILRPRLYNHGTFIHS